MAQHDMDLANQSGAAYRTDHNNNIAALVTKSSGTGAPSPTFANQDWADTTNSRWKKRNNANSAWIDMGPLDNLPDGRVPILTKSAGYTAAAADRGYLIDFTTAGVTLAYTAAATLGADWYCYVRNSAASGILTHDPNSSETLDGATTQTQQPGEGAWLVICDGTGFKTLGRMTAIGMPAGTICGRAIGTYAASADLTTLIPFDDTIPQNTEGTQIISVSYTPKSATNIVRLRFQGMGCCSVAQQIQAALFINSVADALFATSVTTQGTANIGNPSFEFEHVPGSTSAQTYKVRVGGNANTIRMNGIESARRYGGVALCTLVIEEIVA